MRQSFTISHISFKTSGLFDIAFFYCFFRSVMIFYLSFITHLYIHVYICIYILLERGLASLAFAVTFKIFLCYFSSLRSDAEWEYYTLLKKCLNFVINLINSKSYDFFKALIFFKRNWFQSNLLHQLLHQWSTEFCVQNFPSVDLFERDKAKTTPETKELFGWVWMIRVEFRRLIHRKTGIWRV